jgi:hypothetical protein
MLNSISSKNTKKRYPVFNATLDRCTTFRISLRLWQLVLGTEPANAGKLCQKCHAVLLKLQAFRKNLLTPKWVTICEISGQNNLKKF